MKKYEFKLHVINQMQDCRDMIEILNELGNDGWQIASWEVQDYRHSLVLQREKEQTK